jgi:16S rRNA pseudouridine516 synthase
MQLDKLLQSQGFGSRKQCRSLIEQGHVRIAGETIKNIKAPINTQDLIYHVNGRAWPYHDKVYLALYKPAGYECSHQPQRHASVFELFPAPLLARGLQSVGRLDQDTTGLLILTDDGPYLHALTHPKKHVSKRYRVTTAWPITPAQITQLEQGVLLQGEDQLVRADACETQGDCTLLLTIHQGLYHQVKRMLAAVGNHVAALHREQMGLLSLADLSTEAQTPLTAGQWIYLTAAQCALARQSADGLAQSTLAL